jgi:NAD(P)-dependent dehydrogenase (short-subunit alcohol dehydrogenase family)
MTDPKGKTALVTGSTSGIGKATAIVLAACGAHVLVVGRDEQRAKDVVSEIEGSGGSASFRLTTLGGALVRFTDRETALGWYNAPAYQQLIDVRSAAMDARFSLLDGLPTPTKSEKESK